jgi:hypothetical protein
MPRTISPATQAELNALVAGAKEVLILIEITQEALAVPIRVVNDTADITSNGDEFIAFPFRINLPADQEQSSRATVEIDNVTGELMRWLELSRGAPGAKMKIMVVSRATPDTIEAEFLMDLQNLSADRYTVSGQLAYKDIVNQPGVPFSYTHFNTPALF